MNKTNVSEIEMSGTVTPILQDARARPLAYVVQVIGLLIVILNLWIASKLSPIASDIAVITNRVEANHSSITRIDGQVLDQLEKIESKVDRLNERIDKLLLQ